MKIRFIADSGCDIVGEQRENLTVLPLIITFGDEQYLDGVTLSHAEFYQKLSDCEALPTTSQLTPYHFSEAFEQAVQAGETVVAVTISSKLSGTYQNAVIAAADYPGKVYVVDSENVTVGQRALVERGMELAEQGYSAAEIAECLEREKKQIHLIALVDTLEYLKRGGRVSKTVAFAGGLLSVKPVIAIREGAVVILGKARGSRQGNNLLTEEIEKSGGVDFTRPFFLGYTGSGQEKLDQYIADSKPLWEGKTDRLPIMTVGGAIGTHAGPGAVAVAYFSEK